MSAKQTNLADALMHAITFTEFQENTCRYDWRRMPKARRPPKERLRRCRNWLKRPS